MFTLVPVEMNRKLARPACANVMFPVPDASLADVLRGTSEKNTPSDGPFGVSYEITSSNPRLTQMRVTPSGNETSTWRRAPAPNAYVSVAADTIIVPISSICDATPLDSREPL